MYEEPGRQLQCYDNHPAENVSWLDAIAFCRWLGERLAYTIRLPTEWEWQQAATRGDSERAFPWGPEFETMRANTYESELNRTIAVGLYPDGGSPVKALDMAGNIWEWCLNEYENSARCEISGDADRVIRGGSRYYPQDLARAACRLGLHPAVRQRRYWGFRLVCSSPIA